MAHAIAWLAFVALCGVAVYRWTNDVRFWIAPWLRRKLGRWMGTPIELGGGGASPRGKQEWTVAPASSNKAVLVAWASIFTAAIAIFAPVSCIWIAARFGAISWSMAYPLLFIALSLSCLTWLSPLWRRGSSR